MKHIKRRVLPQTLEESEQNILNVIGFERRSNSCLWNCCQVSAPATYQLRLSFFLLHSSLQLQTEKLTIKTQSSCEKSEEKWYAKAAFKTHRVLEGFYNSQVVRKHLFWNNKGKGKLHKLYVSKNIQLFTSTPKIFRFHFCFYNKSSKAANIFSWCDLFGYHWQTEIWDERGRERLDWGLRMGAVDTTLERRGVRH